MDKIYSLSLLMLFLCFHRVICQSSYDFGASQSRLMNDLLYSYNKNIPGTQPVELVFGISPVAVIDVDPRRDLLTIDLWLKNIWNDPRLQWNVDDYGNTSILFMKWEHLFIPEMELYNGKMSPLKEVNEAVLYPNGQLIRFPPVRAEVYCDLPSLPFRGKVCSIIIGPWTHDTRQTKILTFTEVVDTSFISPTGICQIERAWATVAETSYECCGDLSFGTMTLFVNLTCESNDTYTTRHVHHESESRRHHEYLTSTGDDQLQQTKKFFQNSSLPVFLTPFFVLFVFLLPPKPAQRVMLGSLVFACLLLVWTSDHQLQTTESHFVQVSAVVTIAATFLSLATCLMRSTELTSNRDDYGPKTDTRCKNRFARLVDFMLLAVVTVVLGVASAGMFITA